jgi:hypothetical protein
MSHSELTRLEILQRVEDRRLNQTQAATMLGMTPRQMQLRCGSRRSRCPLTGPSRVSAILWRLASSSSDATHRVRGLCGDARV